MLGQLYGVVQGRLFAHGKLRQGINVQTLLGSIAGPQSQLKPHVSSVSGFSDLVRISNTGKTRPMLNGYKLPVRLNAWRSA